MNAWTQVKVNNPALEHHGQAGVVKSQGEPEVPEGETAPQPTSNVLIDGETEEVSFFDRDLVALA